MAEEIWEKKRHWIRQLVQLSESPAKERTTAAERIQKEIELKDPEISIDTDIRAMLAYLCCDETGRLPTTDSPVLEYMDPDAGVFLISDTQKNTISQHLNISDKELSIFCTKAQSLINTYFTNKGRGLHIHDLSKTKKALSNVAKHAGNLKTAIESLGEPLKSTIESHYKISLDKLGTLVNEVPDIATLAKSLDQDVNSVLLRDDLIYNLVELFFMYEPHGHIFVNGYPVSNASEEVERFKIDSDDIIVVCEEFIDEFLTWANIDHPKSNEEIDAAKQSRLRRMVKDQLHLTLNKITYVLALTLFFRNRSRTPSRS